MVLGMEILFSNVHSQLTGPTDALICCLHWNMITNGYKCIGKGEEAPPQASLSSAKRSELLPAGWNDEEGVYSMLYLHDESVDTHLLKVIRDGSSLLVHVLRMSDERLANLTIQIGDYVNDDLSSFESAFEDLDDLQTRFRREILDELKKGKNSSRKSPSPAPRTPPGTRQQPEPLRPYQDDPLREPIHSRARPPPEWMDPENPFAVGGSDLDPFSGGHGGGMFMDPFRGGFPGRGHDPGAGLPGGLPRGAVPPGARFDPFGPVGPGRGGAPNPGQGRGRAGPDPDHLPPPGFDDMFM